MPVERKGEARVFQGQSEGSRGGCSGVGTDVWSVLYWLALALAPANMVVS